MGSREKTARADVDGAPTLHLNGFLPYRFSIVAERISRAFAARYEQAFGLTIPEWRVMAVLGEHAVQTTQEVIERTEMDRVKVSRAVIRLVDKELVHRRAQPADGRAHVLHLSREGRKIYREIVPLAHQMQAELAAALSQQELDVLDRALSKIGEGAKALRAPVRPSLDAALDSATSVP